MKSVLQDILYVLGSLIALDEVIARILSLLVVLRKK